MAFSAGYFSNPMYDKCYYPERYEESTAPFSYITNTNQIYNENACLSTLGARSGYMGVGVSTISGNVPAVSQHNIDVDSILTNRNVLISSCKKGKVNPIDVTKFSAKNLSICNDDLYSENTRLTHPSMFYRGVPINRFYDPIRNPQKNIFFDYATNTVLEAKDNYRFKMPMSLNNNFQLSGDSSWKPKSIKIPGNANCGKE